MRALLLLASKLNKNGLGMDFDRSSCPFVLWGRSNSSLPNSVRKLIVEISYFVRRVVTALAVGKFSSCLIQNFSRFGRKEASAGAKLAGADAAQEAGLQVLWLLQELEHSGRRLCGNWWSFYNYSPTWVVFGLVGDVICLVLNRCGC